MENRRIVETTVFFDDRAGPLRPVERPGLVMGIRLGGSTLDCHERHVALSIPEREAARIRRNGSRARPRMGLDLRRLYLGHRLRMLEVRRLAVSGDLGGLGNSLDSNDPHVALLDEPTNVALEEDPGVVDAGILIGREIHAPSDLAQRSPLRRLIFEPGVEPLPPTPFVIKGRCLEYVEK